MRIPTSSRCLRVDVGYVHSAFLPAVAPFVPDHSAEIKLARKLLQFAETIEVVSSELKSNVLTGLPV